MAATNAVEALGMGFEGVVKGLVAAGFQRSMEQSIDKALQNCRPPTAAHGVLLYVWVHANANATAFKETGANIAGYFKTKQEAMAYAKSQQNLHAAYPGFKLVWVYEFLPPGQIRNPLKGLGFLAFAGASGCTIL
jgi:hypothetical protein